MYKLKDEPYNFGIKHIEHRIFNETPAIERQVVKLVEENHVKGSLLKPKETFDNGGITTPLEPSVKRLPKRSDVPTPEEMRKLMEKDPREDIVIEGFCCKKKSAFCSFIDSVFSVIAIVIFIIFLGYMIWISCFEGWNREENRLPMERKIESVQAELLDIPTSEELI